MMAMRRRRREKRRRKGRRRTKKRSSRDARKKRWRGPGVRMATHHAWCGMMMMIWSRSRCGWYI